MGHGARVVVRRACLLGRGYVAGLDAASARFTRVSCDGALRTAARRGAVKFFCLLRPDFRPTGAARTPLRLARRNERHRQSDDGLGLSDVLRVGATANSDLQ